MSSNRNSLAFNASTFSTHIDSIFKSREPSEDLETASIHSLDSATETPKYTTRIQNLDDASFYRHHILSQMGTMDPVNSRSNLGTPVSSSSFDFTLLNQEYVATGSSINVVLPSDSDSAEASRKPSNQGLDSTTSDAAGRTLDGTLKEVPRAEPTTPSDDVIHNDQDEDEDWAEKGAAEGVVEAPAGQELVRRTVKDFEFGKELGKGSYSTVVLATDKITSVQYAVKILDKRHIIKEKKVKYVNIEKHALNRLSRCNGVISLYFTFQDRDSLYFVLDYASNGELLGLIKELGTLNEECATYFGAQILDAIHNMHRNGVIHRDIKPENILLDSRYRIRITDFGTAKLLERKKNGKTGQEEDYPVDVRAKSFVGTAEYVSPELLENKFCGKPGDVWAFGCIMYQMIAGKPPFKATNEYLTFQKITKLQYAFSAGFPSILRDLIKQIFVLQPSRRATIDQIKKHYFFRDCNFNDPELIWESDVPEMSSYKMTAKSMMKMPALSQQAKPATVIRRPKSKPQPTKSPKTQQLSAAASPKLFTPASVAAYVLHKDDEDYTPPESKPPVESHPPPPPPPPPPQREREPKPQPEYIPGTNILRPQAISRASFSKSSIQSAKSTKDTLTKKTLRVMEVKPPSAVEAAWQQFLSLDERVLNIGLAIVKIQPIEVFEKKNKGMIYDSPLGFKAKLEAASGDRRKPKTMLSHVVQSTKGKAREPEIHYRESDAFMFHELPPSLEAESVAEEESQIVAHAPKLGKAFLKMLRPAAEKKEASVNESQRVEDEHAFFYKARTYTILATSFGRLLLFSRDDHNNNYMLMCEVRLELPFVQFKEVVSNHSSKFGKMIPTTGMFAVVGMQNVLVFETEKYEVGPWTESLAKAKLNQIEREKEKSDSLAAAQNNSEPVSDSPLVVNSDTRLLNGHSHLSDTTEQRGNEQRVPSSGEGRDNLLFHRTMKSRESTRRKPPPALAKSPNLGASGLTTQQGQTAFAAQMAISNSPTTVSLENHRSSYNREDQARVGGYRSTSSSGGPAKITSLNSKFLARTRGKK